MRRFKEAFSTFVKDYFSWLRLYRRRVLYTLVVAEILLIGTTMGFNHLRGVGSEIQKYKSPSAVVETEKMKLKSCSEFVYVLMRENVKLRQHCHNY